MYLYLNIVIHTTLPLNHIAGAATIPHKNHLGQAQGQVERAERSHSLRSFHLAHLQEPMSHTQHNKIKTILQLE